MQRRPVGIIPRLGLQSRRADLPPRAAAGIEQALLLQPVRLRVIKIEMLRLNPHRLRIGQPQPVKIFENRLDKMRTRPPLINILDPQQHIATARIRQLLIDQRRISMAQMQISVRTGGETKQRLHFKLSRATMRIITLSVTGPIMSKLIRTKTALAEAVDALFEHAPYLLPLYELTGPLPLRHHKPGFMGLARLIVSQQVSTASARAIWGRVLTAYPALAPSDILNATDEDLRACGLSAPKIRTLRAIATAVDDGSLPLARLGRMAADKAHALMVTVKGIGPWTADLYLLFCIGHADAFPSGDLALQEGLRMAYELEERPSALALEAYAEDWRPYRGIVAQLLWAYYGVMKQRQGVPD